MPELSAHSSQHEIDSAELVRRYEEKKKILEGSGLPLEGRDIFRAAFREHVAPQAPFPQSDSQVIHPQIPKVAPPASAKADSENELQDLVGIALEKGIQAAVAKAQAETPYLIDALHDELADHYYDKLIASGLLNPES